MLKDSRKNFYSPSEIAGHEAGKNQRSTDKLKPKQDLIAGTKYTKQEIGALVEDKVAEALNAEKLKQPLLSPGDTIDVKMDALTNLLSNSKLRQELRTVIDGIDLSTRREERGGRERSETIPGQSGRQPRGENPGGYGLDGRSRSDFGDDSSDSQQGGSSSGSRGDLSSKELRSRDPRQEVPARRPTATAHPARSGKGNAGRV